MKIIAAVGAGSEAGRQPVAVMVQRLQTGATAAIFMARRSAGGYIGRMMTAIRIPLLAALAFSAGTFQAVAEDRQQGLPGVDGTFSVVGPAAEPETEGVAETSPYGEGFVRIPGTDTYVRISGMVRYDVGFTGRNKKADRLE